LGLCLKAFQKQWFCPCKNSGFVGQKQCFYWSKAVLFKCPYDTHSCYRSFIEMIAKISHLGKLGKAKAKAKRGDFGVKTQAVLRLKVSCFERQSNLSCEAT
jgi:hypothetical protein